MVSTNSVAGMNDDARTEVITLAIPSITEGQRVTIIAKSKHPLDIVAVDRQMAVGDCDLLFSINEVPVEFDDSATDYSIMAETGALIEALPDSTDPNNAHVYVGQKFTLDISNVSSGASGLTVQLTNRLTQINTE